MNNTTMNNAALTARTESNTPEKLRVFNASLTSVNQMLSEVPSDMTAGAVSAKLAGKVKEMHTALKALNDSMAIDFYKVHSDSISDFIREGKCIPAMALSQDADTGVYSASEVKVYPTLAGMKDWLPEGILDNADALRRASAYVAMEGMEDRSIVLWGGTIESNGKKKPVAAPSKATKEILVKWSDEKKYTKTALKDELRSVMASICDMPQSDLLVSSKLVNDFCRFCVTGAGEWGVRTIAGQRHTGDLILEYIHMVLNGKKGFVVKVG